MLNCQYFFLKMKTKKRQTESPGKRLSVCHKREKGVVFETPEGMDFFRGDEMIKSIEQHCFCSTHTRIFNASLLYDYQDFLSIAQVQSFLNNDCKSS